MEKVTRRLILRTIPCFLLLVSLALFTVELRSVVFPSNQWKKQRTNWHGSGIEDQEAVGKEQRTNWRGSSIEDQETVGKEQRIGIEDQEMVGKEHRTNWHGNGIEDQQRVEKKQRTKSWGGSSIEDQEVVGTKQRTNWGGSRIEDQQMVGKKQRTNRGVRRMEDQEHPDSLFQRLVTGRSQTQLKATGFACHSDVHTNVCVSSRPVRIDTRTMKVYAPFSQAMTNQENHTINPYPRREDKTAMEYVSSVQILQGNIAPPLACRYTHNVPAVVFSSGGFTGNIFHEFNEVIIPLFLTTRHFQSRLHFVVTDFRPPFVAKFSKVLSRLSSYEVINPAANESMHCFPGAVVGLHYHDNIAVKTTGYIPEGYSMLDFTQFLRDSFNLKKRYLSQTEKPVLVLISRPKTRMFLNEDQMVTMMKTLRFNVVIAKPDTMVDVPKFAEVMNSCNVLVGAHGAGLTNEIFMPQGAVMVQVVGLNLEWASTAYYGRPATEMGLKYIEYKIEPEESSLISLYGKNHPVITDPASIEAKGYRVGRAVYLEEQNFNISVVRFRKTLVQALELLGRSAPLD
ncbi:xylan glycosyltransferase MUCI21-like [Rhododendron vialii]|uniref:xylan glycosyltransferase MUCI21-like n=1 Tax=Rhododendron vialii TaxID=182163 RepID=UPI00265DA47D|nr:xylan glycosyltransferase MUCI21-like [Rhododendron vialii]